jgi:hypothetical protein
LAILAESCVENVVVKSRCLDLRHLKAILRYYMFGSKKAICDVCNEERKFFANRDAGGRICKEGHLICNRCCKRSLGKRIGNEVLDTVTFGISDIFGASVLTTHHMS